MPTAAKFLLEHFYYGQIVHEGKPFGEPRLLAASAGVSPTLAQQAVARVALPPLIRSGNGSWALVRGRQGKIPFMLVQAQLGSVGQTISHYIIAQPDVLRALGGNLRVLLTLVEAEMPVFDQVGNMLPLLELPQSAPLSVDDQIDDMLELMMVTRNKTSLMEPLLAAIIQGTQLVIQGAPVDLRQRIGFIEGLLALLPPSARFGVTFATHSLPTTEIDTQIRFYSDDVPPPDTLVFNWTQGQVSGADIHDDYSRFIISQLRLDAGLVIERNTAMTHIAGWRLNQGDRLADALGYASQRLRIDEALRNNQPVSKDEVARVLSGDPTLSDEMRLMYAYHLIRFSLAMQDMEHAEPVGWLVRENTALAESVMQLMQDTLAEGHAWLIYDVLVRWLADPEGPKGLNWVDLAHRAVLAYLRDLVDGLEVDGVVDLLQEVQQSQASIDVAYIIPEVVRITRPLYHADPRLIEALFLMAARYLDNDEFKRLMNDIRFRDHLSPQIRRAWGVIATGESYPDAAESFVQIVQSYGDPVVLLRFAELAAESRQFELLQTPTITALVALDAQYMDRLLQVVSTVEQTSLQELEPPGPYHLLQIRLKVGDYEGLARQMIHQSGVLYSGDRQVDYLKMLEKLFRENVIPVDNVVEALQIINQIGVKSVPFIVTAICAISHHGEALNLDPIADQVTAQLMDSQFLMDVIPPAVILDLVTYYGSRQNADGVMRLANVVPVSAVHVGSGGVRMMRDVYQTLDWDLEAQAAGLDMLRGFVRLQDDDERAHKVVAYFGKHLGVRRPLEVTYAFKRMMSDLDLLNYGAEVRMVVELLQDCAALYVNNRRTPTNGDILNALTALPGGLTREERQQLAKDILDTGKALVALGKQYREARPRDEDRYLEALLKRETPPRSGLDILYTVSGYFGRVRRSAVKYGTISYPLEGRTVQNIVDEFGAASDVLRGLVQAFPPKRPLRLKIEEVVAELDGLRATLPADSRVEFLMDLALSVQQLAELVMVIEKDGDARALQTGSGLAKKIDSGKQRPRSVLEFLRFVYGYYAAQR